jgi:hypothetical protein
MPTLTDREKRTVRLAAVAIAVYLVLFFGVRVWKQLEARRSEYQQLEVHAHRLRRDVQPYENRILLAQKLRENFRMNPQKFSRSSLVAEASAAIQKEAGSLKVQLGQVRESAARPSAKELASMQLEGTGPIPAVMALLHRLETLGYPLIVDSVQLTGELAKPGMVKLNLTIIILDFESWKNAEVPGA